MSSYVSELQINSNIPQPVGSSLYGVCDTSAATSAKIVTLPAFDNLVNGVTVHVKFVNGNTAELNNNLTLQVGSTNAHIITNPGGSVQWAENSIISFTYDGTTSNWRVNDGNVTTIAILNTYDSTSTSGISGQGVANALNTLGGAAQKDVITNITNSNKESENLPTTAAITSYIDGKTDGIEGAMHYRGITSSTLSDGSTSRSIVISNAVYTAKPGDVVLSNDTHKEFIWVETNTGTHEGYWELFGDEGTYALNSSTANVIGSIQFNAGTPTEVTRKQTTVLTAISNDNTARAAEAKVENGILKIYTGILPTFSSSQIYEVDSITNGTAPTLSSQTKEVIIPYE